MQDILKNFALDFLGIRAISCITTYQQRKEMKVVDRKQTQKYMQIHLYVLMK